MNKQEFLDRLKKALSGLPQGDIAEQLRFYSEMIDDRMEEGVSEEEAVAAIGSVDEIAAQVLTDTPPREKEKRSIWTIVLLTLGSPVWLSLGIAAVAVTISLYVSLWAVIVSLWAVFGALTGSVPAGLVSGVVFFCQGAFLPGLGMLSGGSICAGLAIFFFFGCKAVTKGFVDLTKKAILGIKRRVCNE